MLRTAMVIAALALAGSAAPALAGDPVTKFEPEKSHPDTKKINERNSMVVHAGPGQPLAGARYEPPKAAKGSPAVGGAGVSVRRRQLPRLSGSSSSSAYSQDVEFPAGSVSSTSAESRL